MKTHCQIAPGEYVNRVVVACWVVVVLEVVVDTELESEAARETETEVSAEAPKASTPTV